MKYIKSYEWNPFKKKEPKIPDIVNTFADFLESFLKTVFKNHIFNKELAPWSPNLNFKFIYSVDNWLPEPGRSHLPLRFMHLFYIPKEKIRKYIMIEILPQNIEFLEFQEYLIDILLEYGYENQFHYYLDIDKIPNIMNDMSPEDYELKIATKKYNL